MFISGLSIVFFFIAIVLALIILFLQGKGDMGATNSWQGGNALFGGGGGQDIIGKIVWVLGITLLILCLILAKYSPKYAKESILNKHNLSNQKENNSISKTKDEANTNDDDTNKNENNSPSKDAKKIELVKQTSINNSFIEDEDSDETDSSDDVFSLEEDEEDGDDEN